MNLCDRCDHDERKHTRQSPFGRACAVKQWETREKDQERVLVDCQCDGFFPTVKGSPGAAHRVVLDGFRKQVQA